MADNETQGTTSTRYERKLIESGGVMVRDELIAGIFKGCPIKISQAGEYKRGLLMMENNGEYIPATAAGTKNKNCIILADDLTLVSGEYAEAAGYYFGRFKADKIILAYETENDSHDELIDAIRINLRMQHIELV